MTALVLSLARALPAPVKARLRGRGRHRKAVTPVVNGALTGGRHKVRTVWDQLDELDPWLLYDLERKDYG